MIHSPTSTSVGERGGEGETRKPPKEKKVKHEGVVRWR